MIRLAHQTLAFVRGTVPIITALMLMLLEFVPYRFAHIQAIMPHLFLAAAYYWALFRPDLMGAAPLFLAGVFYDLTNGGAFGLTAFALVVMHYFAVSQRQILAGRMFLLSWFGFISVAIAYGIADWLLLSMITDAPVKPTTIVMQTLMTISVYPLVARFLGQIHRLMLDR